MTTTGKINITVEATIDASLEKVWLAWNDPKHIVQWNFASDDWHCPASKNDLRPGGKLVSTMAAKDGSAEFDFEATYNEVVKHERISYTIADGRAVLITFKDTGNGVHVSETFEAESTHTPEMQHEGWQAILNNFKKHVESLEK